VTEYQDIIWKYINACDALDVQEWLTEDIVKLIQLMDAELQRRYDEESAIRKECHEAFQTDLFDVGDDDDSGREYESDPW
jgi:hypothetical protein